MQKKNVDQTYNGITILLDGSSFERCVFNDCRMIYQGGEPPQLVNCTFKGSNFGMDGPAANTLAFLNAMYHGGMKSVVEATFDNIRRNDLQGEPDA